MNELSKAPAGALDALAAEARLLTQSIYTSWLRLGGVLTEAKALVRHGEWSEWLAMNAPVGERTAQNMMAAWRRFGDKPPFFGVEGSKLTALLALPDGEEEQFAEQHDLQEMSARAIKEAVKAAREEAEREISAQRRRADEAEARARALEGAEPTIPDEVTRELAMKQARIDELTNEVGRVASDAKSAIDDKTGLLAKIFLQNKLIEDSDARAKEAQDKYLSLLSQSTRGESGQNDGAKLSAETFADATRVYLGACGVMAYMGREFAVMECGQRQVFEQYLQMLEQFARQAREAVDNCAGEVIDA